MQFLFGLRDRTAAHCWLWQDASGGISEPCVPASRSAAMPQGMFSCYHEMDFMNKAGASSVSHACQEHLR